MMVSTSTLVKVLIICATIDRPAGFVKRAVDVLEHQERARLTALEEALEGHDLHHEAKHLEHAGHVKHGQPAGGGAVTSTTNESYLERLQNAMAQFVVGWVLIFFSIPILWFNERRLAKMESLVITGKSEFSTVSAKLAEKEKCGDLVHLQNESMVSAAPVNDSQFDAKFDSNCVRLQSLVEVFQIIEHEKTEEKEKFGGGKEKITTYTYDESWSAEWHDSRKYHNANKRGTNWKLESLNTGSFMTNSKRVELGEGFVLSGALVDQCCNWSSAAERLGSSVAFSSGKAQFRLGTDDHFYFRRNSSMMGMSYSDAKWEGDGSPQVGDCRVRFSIVPDGPVTVLALQAEADHPGERSSFLPYRVIQRPFCGSMETEAKRRAFINQGQKSHEDLADEDGCPGCFPTLCCCACNIVAKCCSALFTPEINHLWDGDKSSNQCFKDIANAAAATTWMIRFGGWLMMFIGLYMTFAPFTEILVILPFLGPILKSVGNFVVGLFSFIVTVLISLIIIMIAWLAYHPLYAFFYSLLIGAVMAAPMVIDMFFLSPKEA
jgi:hypothetical protein